MKISGVSASGLVRLETFLQRADILQPDWEKNSKPFIVLKDAHIENQKRTFLVTAELQLINEGTSPQARMCLSQLIDFFHTLEPTCVPEFDPFGDGDRNLEEFMRRVAGTYAPFEVREIETDLIIIQQGQRITMSRLKEMFSATPKNVEWTRDTDTEDSILLDKLLNWWKDGGAVCGDFEDYRYTPPADTATKMPSVTKTDPAPDTKVKRICPNCWSELTHDEAAGKCKDCR